MRRLLLVGIVIVGAAFVWMRFDEIAEVFNTSQRGDWLWLALAVAVQFAWLLNTALTYQAIYRLLDMSVTAWHLVPLVVTGNFLNVVTPTGGMSGMAVFLHDARRAQRSTARVTIAGVLFALFDYFSFLCVVGVGLLVLAQRASLNAPEIGATLILLAAASGLTLVLILGIKAPHQLEKLLIASTRAVNGALLPFTRRPFLAEARAHEFATEAAEGLRALRTDARAFLAPAGHALLGKLLLITLLWLTFLAFHYPLPFDTLIAGFSIGSLFMIVSPTPAGVGIVETVMPAALTALGVPTGVALVVVLVYRGFTFWLPVGYGFIALRMLEQRWGKPLREGQS